MRADDFVDPDKVKSPGIDVGEHKFKRDRQYNPVLLPQSLVPQVQSLSLTTKPLLLLQAGTFAHLFEDTRQNNPVLLPQSLVPQVQSSSLAVKPPLFTQFGIF
jgi:hypothetical protein